VTLYFSAVSNGFSINLREVNSMISKGDYIKGYIVEERLGGGGFGEVYLVNDGRDPTRKYAMKIIKSELTYNLMVRESFLNEMLNMARLSQHPNILSIINSLLFNDDEGERVGMVTEYLEGVSLGLHIHRHGPLGLQEAVPIFLQVLDAIGYAHKMGIIHRDIKPSNIMLEPDKSIKYREYTTCSVKVLDFGLSKALEGASTVESMSGATLSYAAPERFKKGAQIDLRTDVYSLGITLFEMLTGRPPFVIRSLSDAMEPVLGAEPPSILRFIERCPIELDVIIRRALARAPADRYDTCEDMAKDLMVLFPAKPPEAKSALEPATVEKEPVREDKPSKEPVLPIAGGGDQDVTGRVDSLPGAIGEVPAAIPSQVSKQETDFSGRTEPPPASAAPPIKGKRVLLSAAAVAAVCLIAVMAFLFTKQRPEEYAPKSVQQTAGEGATPQEPASVPPVGPPETTPVQRSIPTWQKFLGGGNEDEAGCIRQTTDEGYIMSGWSRSFGRGLSDPWVVRLDAEGKELWNKTYGAAGDGAATLIQETSDHGYVVTGWSSSRGGNQALVIRLDPNGNKTWSKTFGGERGEESNAILQTADGGYVFAGWTLSYGKGRSAAWVVRIDGNGKEIWNKTYGGLSYDAANYIAEAADGGYVFAGWSLSYGKGKSEAWVVKIDQSGREIWNKTFGGGSETRAMCVQQTRDGGFIVVGEAQPKSDAAADALVIKLDGDGKTVWRKSFGGNDEDKATCAQQTKDGGYIVAGYTRPIGTGRSDVLLIKLNAEGTEVWTKTYGGTKESKANFVQETLDGGYVVAGWTTAFGSGKKDAWIIKLNAEGNLGEGNPVSPGGQR
jgi:serine/threonine protein kinase